MFHVMVRGFADGLLRYYIPLTVETNLQMRSELGVHDVLMGSCTMLIGILQRPAASLLQLKGPKLRSN